MTARAAYEAYCAALGIDRTPAWKQWDDLPPQRQQAWSAAARPDPAESEIEALCRERGWEWHVDLTTGTDCFWGCKLTVVLTPDRADGPDRSLVTFAAGGTVPDDVLRAAWDDMRAWLDTLTIRAGNVRRARARIAGEAGS